MINIERLPNRKANETSVMLLRRHWIVPSKIIIFLLLATIFPVLIYFLIKAEAARLLANSIITPLLALTAAFYYLAIWMFVFQEIVDYFLDMWIITSERIVNIEQEGLFKRTSSELHLANIVDATSQVSGVLHTLLNYGDVQIQTAGEKTRFHFKQVPHPAEVRQEVLRLVDEDRGRHQNIQPLTPTEKINPPTASRPKHSKDAA